MKYIFPKLKNWQDFEILCKDAMSKKLSINFSQFGRHGQKQNGIDFYAQDYSTDTILAIQCKNTNRLTIEQIRKDMEKIKNLKMTIKTLYFMTSSNRCSILQEQTTNISTIPVEIIFWEDIEEILNDYPEIVSKYYPNHHDNQTTLEFFDGRENFFQVYSKSDTFNELRLVSTEYHITIEIHNQDICIRYNDEVYSPLNIYENYVTLIDLPFKQLYFYVQELYKNESILEFKAEISKQWGVTINVGLESVIYNGSYYIKNEFLYSDEGQEIDPISSKYLFNIINHLKTIHSMILKVLPNKYFSTQTLGTRQ